MATATFKASRADGRSDREILVDLVKDGQPDNVFSYETLIAALQTGVDEPVHRQRAQQAVASANKTLLREHKRYLRVVPNIGYRVVPATEHLPLAVGKKTKAESCLKQGMALLDNTDLGQLNETDRKLVQGQAMIMSALLIHMRDTRKKHDEQDKAINDVRRRIERLEQPEARTK